MKFTIHIDENKKQILENLCKIDKLVKYCYSLKISDDETKRIITSLHGHLDCLKRYASAGLRINL